MSTIINTPSPTPAPAESSSAGLGIVLGVIIAIAVIVIFLIYGLPALRSSEPVNEQPGDININVDLPPVPTYDTNPPQTTTP